MSILTKMQFGRKKAILKKKSRILLEGLGFHLKMTLGASVQKGKTARSKLTM